MTIEEAIRYEYHELLGPDEAPCMCNMCREAGSVRAEEARKTREEALRRGLSQEIADRAGAFRLNPDMTIDLAIQRAKEREGG